MLERKICDDRSILVILLIKGESELEIFVVRRERELFEVRRRVVVLNYRFLFLKIIYRIKIIIFGIILKNNIRF